MSDHFIVLIPEDPQHIPSSAKQELARAKFAQIAPDAEGVSVKNFETVTFFDCGANLERILCPSCGSEIPFDWWQKTMDADYDGGFRLSAFATPCCNSPRTLNDLVYEWPQGFGRFALTAMNPNTGKLDVADKKSIESALGAKLRVIHRRV